MNLKEASKKAFEIAKKRGQYKFDGNDVLKGLKHCAGEVLEANEAYNNWTFLGDDEEKENYENELADIIICVLSICGGENIDIEKAIARKMKINEGRIK